MVRRNYIFLHGKTENEVTHFQYRPMGRWILHNIWLKVGTIIFAFLLWFHVASERLVFENVSVPIKLENLPDELVIVNNVEREVSFQIKTKVKQLILLNLFGHPYISVDLTNIVSGKNSIKLSEDWINLPSWRPLDITGLVRPKQLLIETEKMDKKQVSVRVVTKGTPQDKTFIKKIMVEPDSIVLIGGKRKLNEIEEIETDTVDVSKRSKNYNIEKWLIIPDGGFSSETQMVRVSILFERYVTKAFRGVAITLKGDGDFTVDPESIVVTVGGPENLLEGLKPSDIKAYIDVKDNEKYVIPYFNLPEGIVFVCCEPGKVKVRLKESKSE
jgi:YbbR domain-containing protein